MLYKLKKDITIPKGSLFYAAPHMVEMTDNHVGRKIELGKDCYGDLFAFLPDCSEWFEEVE